MIKPLPDLNQDVTIIRSSSFEFKGFLLFGNLVDKFKYRLIFEEFRNEFVKPCSLIFLHFYSNVIVIGFLKFRFVK